MGKSTSTNYWIIQLPDGRACWLLGQYAVVEGNVGSLPEYVIPPAPIPTTAVPALGSITGTIMDGIDFPIANAIVIAQLAGRVFTTGGDGKYSFQNLPLGTEFITVETSSYNPEFREVNVGTGDALVEDFVLIEWAPAGGGGNVEGRVLFNGAPAAGVNVWVLDPRFHYLAAITDSNGQYRIGVSCGNLLFVAELGNLRGGTQVGIGCPDPDAPEDATPTTTVAPDIILLPR
jgi:hypothetical protein